MKGWRMYAAPCGENVTGEIDTPRLQPDLSLVPLPKETKGYEHDNTNNA